MVHHAGIKREGHKGERDVSGPGNTQLIATNGVFAAIPATHHIPFLSLPLFTLLVQCRFDLYTGECTCLGTLKPNGVLH